MFALAEYTLHQQGVTILDKISLKINHGEKVALLGASGAGKSSLLGALRTCAPADAAWCPQQGDLVPQLSVFHNLYMGALHRRTTLTNMRTLISPAADIRDEIEALADQLGLSDQLWQSIDQLSGGQAQRTALGRALYSRKPVLLADEPVSAIDELQAETLLRLALAQHATCVMALHDQQHALKFFDRVIGLRSGKIVLDSSVAALRAEQLRQLYQ